jgi:hypothetical protein
MGTSSDRGWIIRDAVLRWIYLKAMLDRDRHPILIADEITKVVGCQGEPMTAEEVDSASDWLLAHQHIRCTDWSNGARRASMTAKGETFAASNISVRGGNKAANIATTDPGETQIRSGTRY